MLPDTVASLEGKLVVSCQALPDEPLYGSHFMAAMARAAAEGGAGGIRANGPDDIRAIRSVTKLPIIGLYKVFAPDSAVYITPTFHTARAVVEAGADIVAIDGTGRQRPGGETLRELIRRIHTGLNRPVLADVSTVAEGLAAAEAGAELLSTTLSGYTEYSPHREEPDFALLRELVAAGVTPIIMEGRMWTREQVTTAFDYGAFAVVVGTAITRPQEITRRFVEAVRMRRVH